MDRYVEVQAIYVPVYYDVTSTTQNGATTYTSDTPSGVPINNSLFYRNTNNGSTVDLAEGLAYSSDYASGSSPISTYIYNDEKNNYSINSRIYDNFNLSVVGSVVVNKAPENHETTILYPDYNYTFIDTGNPAANQTTTTNSGTTFSYNDTYWVDVGPAASGASGTGSHSIAPLSAAEQQFANDLAAHLPPSSPHPYVDIANFIRGNLGEYEAAAQDTAQRPAIVNGASLSPNGELVLGAGAAIAGGFALAAGSPLIGAALVVGGALTALDGAISSADLAHIGQDIKHFEMHYK